MPSSVLIFSVKPPSEDLVVDEARRKEEDRVESDPVKDSQDPSSSDPSEISRIFSPVPENEVY